MLCFTCKINPRYITPSGHIASYCMRCKGIKKKKYSKPRKPAQFCRKTYEAQKYSIDPIYKLRKLLRDRTRKALKAGTKSGSAIQDLGCSIEELKIHLESLFHFGMSWDNHGEWHIDHILPLSRFDLTDRAQFIKVCHFSNLQPLWAIENQSKYNKV